MTYWFYYLVRFLLRVCFRFGFGFDVRGREHVPRRGGFVLASTHTSFLDPPVLAAACPRRLHFMARSDLFRHPLLGAFMRGVHVIPLRRGEGDLEAIRAAVHMLSNGEGVAIFPEGGRQLSGRLGAAKRGVGLLAEAAEVPIVPVFISGTFHALPPSENRLHRAKIRVAFGAVIPYTTASAQRPARTLHEHLADAVTQAWRRLAAQTQSGAIVTRRTP